MKLAILGTGFIITDALDAISEVEGIEKNAIYARPGSEERGEEFARKYGIKRVYNDYQMILDSDDVDTVYVDGKEKHFNPKPMKNRMVQEFIDFERIVREKDREEMEREMEDTLAVMKTIEEARESSGIQYRN